MTRAALRYLSLFSGIGGFDLGFDRAGMECAGQVEYDAAARSVLARHWPDVPRINDVREVTGHEFGTIDLICGGFPCQDVSVAGRRAGLAGERSGLWYEFHRLVDAVKPGIVIVENVPGLLSSNSGRDFAVILRGLVECGYGVAWRILDAQYFGVAQRRRRVFIVGSLGDGRAAEILFEREGGGGDIAEGRKAGARIAHAVTGSSVSSGYRYDPNGEDSVIAGTLAPCAHPGGFNGNDADRGMLVTFEPYHDEHEGRGANFRPTDSHGALRGPNGTDNVLALQMNYIRRERIGDKVGTLAAQPGDAQFNGLWDMKHGVRRLTPVECERLQGFDDDWTAGQSDSARYRQLGNAVAVPVAEWLGRRIVEATP